MIFFKKVGFPTKIYSNHTKFVFWDCFGMIFVGNITSLKNITPEMAEKTVKMCFGYLPKQKFCFGRYRNRKLFYSFGKTEIRPKWPKFGRKPKPNLFRSYTKNRSDFILVWQVLVYIYISHWVRWKRFGNSKKVPSLWAVFSTNSMLFGPSHVSFLIFLPRLWYATTKKWFSKGVFLAIL